MYQRLNKDSNSVMAKNSLNIDEFLETIDGVSAIPEFETPIPDHTMPEEWNDEDI